MPNDMMIAALNAQRQGKMDKSMPPSPSGQDTSGGDLAARVAELEKNYQDLCQYVGMPKQETEEKDPIAKPEGKPY